MGGQSGEVHCRRAVDGDNLLSSTRNDAKITLANVRNHLEFERFFVNRARSERRRLASRFAKCGVGKRLQWYNDRLKEMLPVEY